MPVRAKFVCTTVETGAQWPNGEPVPRTYRFSPQYDPTVPDDQRYARYTPSGELRITVDNPAVEFVPGDAYYLDVTPVEESP